MDVIHTQNQLIQTLKGLTHIAFVPTMGNLHEGHIKLIQEASKVSRNIVVSIFINPLQFNSKEDFKNYPRTLKEDLSILKELDIPFVFAPSEEDILDSLENIELVCIDGIESLVGNKAWEIGLFNLINRSFNSNNRLIFTSAKNIDGMNFELKDLDSRLRKIQSHELHSLADDDILYALKHIANLRCIELGSKEAQYLLTYADRNISDLVKILESLDQLSMEMKRRITIPLIKQVI